MACISPSSSASPALSEVLEQTAHQLKSFLADGDNADVSKIRSCLLILARGIDIAVSNGDVPKLATSLPSVIKLAFEHQKDQSLQASYALLMLSVKNACKSGWFQAENVDELLTMSNELCDNYCMTTSTNTEVSYAMDTLSFIISRYYCQVRLVDLIVCVEAKPGFETVMTSFNIKRDHPPDQQIGLFVVKTDGLETSSCLVSPPKVNFLVNGKGVARRTNVYQDGGPQLPSDITKMLKYGMNILQAIGYFDGNYIIAIAFMSNITSSSTLMLKAYVQPAEASHDSDVIEGSSKVSLNCPISHKRIRTPVKGHLCKHHQCFDYENFLEMNSRKPSWRCACCFQPTSFVDLRLDQNMMKILQSVKEDASDVIISADGSWKEATEQNRSTCAEKKVNEIHNEPSSISPTRENVVDLTMDADPGSVDNPYETERKSSKNTQKFPVSQLAPEQALPPHATVSHQTGNDALSMAWSLPSVSQGLMPVTAVDSRRAGTLESLVPSGILNPIMTDAISPALGQSTFQVNQPLRSYHSVSPVGPITFSPTLSQSCQMTQQVAEIPNQLSQYQLYSASQYAMGAYTSPIIPLDDQARYSMFPNFRGSQTVYQCTTTPVQSWNAAGTASRNSTEHYDRSLAPQSAAQFSSVQLAQPISHRARASFQQLQNMVRMPMGVSVNERMPEFPSDSDWQPSGTMRGSLVGQAYAAGLQRYVPPSQQVRHAM